MEGELNEKRLYIRVYVYIYCQIKVSILFKENKKKFTKFS